MTLIERAAGNEGDVVRLARNQERELRQWLFSPETVTDASTSFVGLVGAIEHDVENDYGVRVELVTVGDCVPDERVTTLVAAGREAAINAAKWSQAESVSIFTEVETNVDLHLRSGPRRGLRPRRGTGRPPGHRLVDPPAHEPTRRRGVHQHHGRFRHRSATRDAPVTVSDSSRPRVFLVDDHELIRAGIKAEIAGSVEIVGEADEVEAAIEMILERIPRRRAARRAHARRRRPGGPARGRSSTNATTRFLALSVSDAANDVISVIRAGARGYVTKNISGPDLIDAIYRIAAGDVVFSPRLAGFVLDAFSTGTDDQPVVIADPDLDQLTARERQVLRLIARGYSYKDIAKELTISTKTVESHVSSVLRKLQLSSRYQLSHWASERNLN